MTKRILILNYQPANKAVSKEAILELKSLTSKTQQPRYKQKMNSSNDLHDQLEIEALRKRLEKLTAEGRTLDDFIGQALQLVGEYIGACSLIVSIQDSKQDCEVICARLSWLNNRWKFDLADVGTFSQSSPQKGSRAQDFSNHPLHSFVLALPPPPPDGEEDFKLSTQSPTDIHRNAIVHSKTLLLT